MKLFLTFVIGIICNNLFSQNINSNKSLKKLNFEDIRIKLIENLEDDKKFRYYADYYIVKAKKQNDILQLIKGYGFKVESYPLKEGLIFADSMHCLVKQKLPNQLAYYYYKIGNLYYKNRLNKKGLASYLLAYKNCNTKEKELLNAISTQIGFVRSTLDQHEEAIAILKENENYDKDKSPIHYLAQQYVMAESYNALFELETAKKMIDNGLVLASKLKSDLYIERFKATKGINLYNRKKYNEALNVLIPILKNANYVKEDFTDYAFISYYIAKCYEGQKNKILALQYHKKTDSVFIKHNDVYGLNIDSYKFIIDFYKEKKDLKNQLVYTERLIKADSLLMNSNEFALKKINKEYDIPELMIEKDTIIKTLKQNNTYSKILIGTLVFGIICLGVLYFRNKIRNKNKIALLKNNLDNYISIQQKNFENKNKFSITEIEKSSNNQELQGKMSDETKDNILNDLIMFEKNKDYLKKTCSLESLSKDFNTNKTYLSKIINENKGYSYSTYVNNLRIEYTLELLKTDKKIRKYSIESIADEVGYNNAKAFSKAFYERINIKPSIFIKNMEK